MGPRAARLAVAALAVAAGLAPPELAPPVRAAEARLLRYDLRPGDHLVYRESLERRARSSRDEQHAVLAWDAHVLVVDEAGGSWRVGIQRTRTRGELLRHVQSGRDAIAAGREAFAAQLAGRGPSFAEANWIGASGRALLPWSAVREATSERLPLFHELEPLPAAPVGPGTEFRAPGLVGLPMRAAAAEAVAGEECLRLEGAVPDGALRLRQWHCQGSGTLGRLEYEARYGGPGGAEIEESYRLERVSITRDEAPAAWLRAKPTAEAALAALAASERLVVPAEAVYAALDGVGVEAERLALAVAWRHRLAPPPLRALERLAASPSPRVRTLAARHLGRRSEPEAAALLERLRADGDGFVRAAATPRPAADEALVRLARTVRGSDEPPAWTGPIEAGLGRRALAAQRAGGQVQGATLRFLRARAGWPYVLHVPEDYRGDEPYPLVVVLGGGPGRAMPAAQTARGSIAPRGELVAFPQANGMWWDENAGAALEQLFSELLRELNVDTDRVTITGFSNGGTGSVLFASRRPDRYAAAASLMGGGLPFFEEGISVDPDSIARVPFLFVHGTRDEVIPPWASERSVKALRRANPAGTAELHLLPGRAHDVVYGREEGLTLPFLARHVRDPFPRKVALRTRSEGAARAFWVEVVEKGGGRAEVDAAAEGNRIALRTRHVRKVRLLLRPELVDFGEPLTVTIDGRSAFEGRVEADPALFLRTWRETGDPQLAAAAEVVLGVR